MEIPKLKIQIFERRLEKNVSWILPWRYRIPEAENSLDKATVFKGYRQLEGVF